MFSNIRPCVGLMLVFITSDLVPRYGAQETVVCTLCFVFQIAVMHTVDGDVSCK